MAHTFDNRRISPVNQTPFYRIPSPNLSAPADTSNLRRRDLSPRLTSDEHLFHPIFAQRSNSPSPNQFHSDSFRSYSSPLTIQTSNHYQRQSITDMKPPQLITRPSRITSTTNNNYLNRSTISPYTSSSSSASLNGFKMNTTYLNSAQLYITQPSEDRPRSPSPPPPPPRQPLYPPNVALRNDPITNTVHQRNSITIPDFNSSPSPNSSRTHAIYRSPVPQSPITFNESSAAQSLIEHRTLSPSINEENHSQGLTNGSTVGEYFGECDKCHRLVTSADDPCDVLGKIYHASCAVCILCGRSVKNKHFYLKDHLYCEEDFLYTGFQQTLEHCVACGHLITDTIIQALGRSYHLYCFKCSKCSVCLDGLPFAADPYQNLFCLPDYHLTYGLRCYKCSDPIVPEDNSNETVRIVSMGKNYHVNCYRCEDCSIQLNDEADRRCFPVGDRLYCQACCHHHLVSVHKF